VVLFTGSPVFGGGKEAIKEINSFETFVHMISAIPFPLA
jgi:hypothetical protein